MRENWVKCKECSTRASGLWSIRKDDEFLGLVCLCAQCGLYDYVHRRETFSPNLRLSLIRTFRTDFQQRHTSTPTVPVKHWVEHSPVPERKVAGIPISAILKANATKRHGPSSVHPSLLNFHKD